LKAIKTILRRDSENRLNMVSRPVPVNAVDAVTQRTQISHFQAESLGYAGETQMIRSMRTCYYSAESKLWNSSEYSYWQDYH